MLGELTLMFSTYTSFDATEDFLSRRKKFLEIFRFTEVRLLIVLAEEAFHTLVLLQ